MLRDKLIGVLTITAALLFIAFLVFEIRNKEKGANNIILVQFHEMGALQNQDVVSIRGLEVGHVASITRANEKALVKIVLDEPRIFRKDTRFRNISPNIMGSRSIAVEPGKNGEIAPSGHIFDGEFESGLAEILYMTDIAKENIAYIMDFIRLLHTGDKNNTSLQEKYEEIMEEIEDLIATLSDMFSIVERQTMGALDKVGYYMDEVSDASITIGNSLDTIRVQAKDGVKAAGDIISKVKVIIEDLNNVLVQFENSPVTIALMNKKEIVEDIEGLRSALQTFVNSIDEKGIKIFDEKGKRKSMIRWKNIHLIGETAKSKARKRAEETKVPSNETRIQVN
jgi:DNA-directed RNA polymerase subunit L